MPVKVKNIVILGGSYGGVSCAHSVLKHAIPQLPENDSYKVVLISASSQVWCRPAAPRAMISDDMFEQQKLFVDIPGVFEQYPKTNFGFVKGTAIDLDHINRIVTVKLADDTSKTEAIDFHSLVIATGASTLSPLLSLNQDEVFLKLKWNELRQALSSARHIVISGGGPSAIEAAGELGEYLNGRSGWWPCTRLPPKVPITVVSGGAQILPLLRPSIADIAQQHLARVGVTVIKNTRVTNVEPSTSGTADAVATNTILTLSTGETLIADVYIPATGMIPNTSFIKDETLLTADGRIETNRTTLRVDKAGPRIYAIGDVSNYARPAVHNILAAVPVVSANIKRDLLIAAGKDSGAVSKDHEFKEDTSETQMVPIGKSKGVGAAMGYKLPSFMVWLIKGRDYWLWTTGKLWSGKQWAKEA